MELGGNAPFIVFDDADLDARRRGRDHRQIPQLRPDLRVHQPLPRAGRHLRQVRREARRPRASAEGRQRPRAGRAAGPADRREGGREGRGAHRRRGRQGRQGRRRRQAPRARRLVLRADRRSRTSTPEMSFTKEEIFGPVAPVFKFETEEEAIALANDTEFGLACLFLHAAISAAPSASWKALKYGMVGVNEGLITTRGRAVRRRQGIRPRPRGLEIRPGGLPRRQICLHRRRLIRGVIRNTSMAGLVPAIFVCPRRRAKPLRAWAHTGATSLLSDLGRSAEYVSVDCCGRVGR